MLKKIMVNTIGTLVVGKVIGEVTNKVMTKITPYANDVLMKPIYDKLKINVYFDNGTVGFDTVKCNKFWDVVGLATTAVGLVGTGLVLKKVIDADEKQAEIIHDEPIDYLSKRIIEERIKMSEMFNENNLNEMFRVIEKEKYEREHDVLEEGTIG